MCYLCLVLVILSRLFSAALWSPAGKGLASWLLFVMFNCVFVTIPCGILGQVWYLIVSIPDFCCLSLIMSHEILVLIAYTSREGSDLKRFVLSLIKCNTPILFNKGESMCKLQICFN